MSNTLTPSGLQSSAGLYGSCGVYQFDRNGAIFNPLDLNPYLLFDAESSMIGTLENPTLDLDPTKQESLDVITATRAGTATFVNLDGEIEIAQPNTVRVDSSLGYPAILVEPSSENLVAYSEDFSHSSWSKQDINVSSAPVAAPDGTMNASHVVKTGSNGHLVTVNIGAANTHTSSIWARTVSGSGTCIFTGNNGVISTVTEEWQRFEVASTNSHMYAVNFRGTSTLTEIYIWGAQLETGSVATSYIPTSGGNTAARTRAADDIVISGSAFTDFYNGSEGTFYVELIDKNILDSTSHLYLHGGGNNLILYSNGNSANVANYDGVNFLQFSGIPSNQLIRMALSYESSTKKLSVNGNTSSDSTYNGNYAGISSLTLGTNLTGHYRRILFWPYSSDSL